MGCHCTQCRKVTGHYLAACRTERERFDVHEYSVTENWILVPAGKSKNRLGQPLLIKLRGHIRVQYPSQLDDLLRAGALDFPLMSAASLEQGG